MLFRILFCVSAFVCVLATVGCQSCSDEVVERSRYEQLIRDLAEERRRVRNTQRLLAEVQTEEIDTAPLVFFIARVKSLPSEQRQRFSLECMDYKLLVEEMAKQDAAAGRFNLIANPWSWFNHVGDVERRCKVWDALKKAYNIELIPFKPGHGGKENADLINHYNKIMGEQLKAKHGKSLDELYNLEDSRLPD